MTRTFKISAKEIKKKDGTGSFISCSAKIGDNWYRVKFTRDCERTPKRRGLYDITVNDDNMSIQKGKIKSPYAENDTLWVRVIDDIRRYTNDEVTALNTAKLSKVFDKPVDAAVDDLAF